MKKFHIHKRLFSLVLVTTLLFSLFCSNVIATDSIEKTKIDPMLVKILEGASTSEMVPVSIWFEDMDKKQVIKNTIESVDQIFDTREISLEANKVINDQTGIIDVSMLESKISLEEIQYIITSERQSARKFYEEYNFHQLNSITNFIDEYNLIYNCKFAPNVVLELRKADIYTVSRYDIISIIYHYDERALNIGTSNNEPLTRSVTYSSIETDDCLAAISSNSSFTGENIKIGMIETSVPVSLCKSLRDITNEINYDPNLTNIPTNINSPTAKHSTIVASLMIGKYEEINQEYLGMVPDAELYATSTNTVGGWKAGIEWLINSGVNVINISNTLVNDRYTDVNDVSRWIDHISYQHSVTIVAAVGYFKSITGEYNISPLAFANNIIVVGAVDLGLDENNNYVFIKNKNSAYSSEGRYFPHIVAPGNPGKIPECNAPNTVGESGNSFASPLVVGAVVQMIQSQPTLATNPTLIKSLIMVGADGKKSTESPDNPYSDMDRVYGAGIINVQNSFLCMSTSSVPKTFTYQYGPTNQPINLEMCISNPGKVRLALNWQAKSIYNSEEHTNIENLSTYPFSFMFITVTAPNGDVYAANDVTSTCQLLEFNASSSELGLYTITITRNGPCGYSTPVSLAVYPVEYIISN